MRLIIVLTSIFLLISCNNKTKKEVRSLNYPRENLDFGKYEKYRKFEDFIDYSESYYTDQRSRLMKYNISRFKTTGEYYIVLDKIIDIEKKKLSRENN